MSAGINLFIYFIFCFGAEQDVLSYARIYTKDDFNIGKSLYFITF